MKIKKGVKVKGIKPEMMFPILICRDVLENIWPEYEMTITSVTDGVHMKGSKHYVGWAFDVRTRDFPEVGDIPCVLKILRDNLGDGFDVVYEKDHIHIEFDPEICN